MIEIFLSIEKDIREETIDDDNQLIQVENKWKSLKGTWNVLTSHRNVDEIDIKMEKLKVYYEKKELVECLATISQLKLLITDISRGEELCVVNIL